MKNILDLLEKADELIQQTEKEIKSLGDRRAIIIGNHERWLSTQVVEIEALNKHPAYHAGGDFESRHKNEVRKIDFIIHLNNERLLVIKGLVSYIENIGKPGEDGDGIAIETIAHPMNE